MNGLRVVVVALAVLARNAAADDGPFGNVEGSLAAGYASYSHRTARAGTQRDGGLALSLRVEDLPSPRVGIGLSFTWGLTDWDRAREYIDAGNRAGSWTTDRLADVEAWATKKDAREGTRGLRYLGAFFADMFLLMTYVAVPACYVGSVGGATSHLQLDATATFHLADRSSRADGWLEVGVGGAWLPVLLEDWRAVYGPVLGLGMRVGVLKVGARVLLSPPFFNEAPYGGPVALGALTLGIAR